VLERFVEFFRDKESIDQIGADDLSRYIIALKKDHNLGAHTILHNAIIVAQFFKRQGRGSITRGLQLPERITPLPREYRTADLTKFFKAAYDTEKLFSTFLLTGIRELEVVHLFWADVSFELQTVRVTAKPELGFYPKRWEEREVPISVLLDRCKAVAERAGLDPAKFDLKTFRSTFASRTLRAGFDVPPFSTGWGTSHSKPRCDIWSHRRKYTLAAKAPAKEVRLHVDERVASQSALAK
jgi:site-specific recombinase XerD